MSDTVTEMMEFLAERERALESDAAQIRARLDEVREMKSLLGGQRRGRGGRPRNVASISTAAGTDQPAGVPGGIQQPETESAA